MEWETFVDDLVAWGEGEGLERREVETFVAAVEAGMADYHEARGQRMTWTRKAQLAARLRKVAGKGGYDCVLYALEIYADRHATTKDWRYCAKIAENMVRETPKERDARMAAHRKANPGGVFDAAFAKENP